MHGPLDVPQWRQDSRGLTFGACRWGIWSLPYSRGGSCILLGEEPELLETPKATSLPECLEIPEPHRALRVDWPIQLAESTEQTDVLSTSSSSVPCALQPSHHPSPEGKETLERDWGLTQTTPASGLHSYLQKNEWVLWLVEGILISPLPQGQVL